MINGMNDVMFGFGDIITLGSLLVTILAGWFKLKFDKEKLLIKINSLNESMKLSTETYKEEVMSTKNSRSSIRKEFHEADKEIIELMNKRVDKLQDVVKEDRNNNNQEFKEMNNKLNEILGSIGELKGLITKA